MKKIIVSLLLVIVMTCGLCGCNKQIIDTKWEYNKAILLYGDTHEVVDIKSWNEDETTFTLMLADGRTICTSQMNVILIEDK